ncbi:hypothetical protein N0V95_009643 [Ascochyta clinopodiicola]|nr:hypothetical protein N0V95_009643 [Ascochyta clinopodiicola]
MGDVYTTVVHGFYLAWKRIHLKRKVEVERYMKEIDIMKKLSYAHMIRLIGTYTHRQFLGLLLHPIAICDLSTFFEDVEAYWSDSADGAQRSHLAQLHFCSHESSSYKASSIYLQLGCLVSAVAYLHDQKIRHKDLKPSNILMVPEGLYLSDFGSATDVSLRSRSASENEQGTPKYFAPEVCPLHITLKHSQKYRPLDQDARYEPSGRAADISSLGCVLLEILILNTEGSLKRLRANCLTKDPAFHAIISQIDAWLPLRDDVSARDYNLYKETRAMLQGLPDRRPMAQDLIQRLVLYDGFDLD